MQLIKTNFLNLVILVLLVILLLQRCGGGGKAPEKPTITRDTVWVHKDSTVYAKPQLIKTIPVNLYHDTTIREYLPDTNYLGLLKQYQDVVYQLLDEKIYVDSLKIDSLGYVKVRDTLSKNAIVGRSYSYRLKYPIVKITVTNPAPKRNQVFIGGGIQGDRFTPVKEINAGLLFKSKRDAILGATIGVDKDANILYGIHSYWKIKL